MNDFELYGKNLTGDETELELAQLKRCQYLKTKMRGQMLPALGDADDNIADLTKAVMLGLAIRQGLVIDEDILSRYETYLSTMLAGYGGAENIMNTLESALAVVGEYVVAGYYQAKQQIMAETDIDKIRMIDLPGEPENIEI